MTREFRSLLLTPFAKLRAIKQYSLLCEDIVREMPWTMAELTPLILPYFPAGNLPSMGYITASLQTRFFVLLITRQVLKDQSDYIFSITSACYPNEKYPMAIALQTTSELEGIMGTTVCNCRTLAEFDGCLNANLNSLKKHFSCEEFMETRLVMRDLLARAFQGVAPSLH